MKNDLKLIYESPATLVLEIKAEGIICNSPLADMHVIYEEEVL